MPNYEEIQRAYQDGMLDGTLEEECVLRVPGEPELAVLPAGLLDAIRADNERLTRQLDDIKTEKSMNWFSAQGFDDKLIDPEMEGTLAGVVAEAGPPVPEARITLERAPRPMAGAVYEVVRHSGTAARDVYPTRDDAVRAASSTMKARHLRPSAQAGALRTHKRKTFHGA
jgi:hypothetical protein